ncbi:spexin [Hyaena hyaena]|uniref:spexin n=1 Tax=Hyaena hyaena TaxID=95912 RepID=UPI0019239D26|nr:spexin [Hyaena hyaena]
MKGLRSLVATTLALFLVFSFIENSSNAPQGLFERRNWTPQSMLYLKGARRLQTGLGNTPRASEPDHFSKAHERGRAGCSRRRQRAGRSLQGEDWRGGRIVGRAAQGQSTGKGSRCSPGVRVERPKSSADPGRHCGPTPPGLGTRGAEHSLTAIVGCLACRLSPSVAFAEGRRFISDQSRKKDLSDRLPPERRSPNLQLLTLPETAALLLASLQRDLKKLEKKTDQTRVLEDY